MKNIVKGALFMAASMMLCLFSGCSNSGEEPDNNGGNNTGLTYVLSSDATEVHVDEIITFAVKTSEGNDVSSSWSLCDDKGTEFPGMTLSYSEPGKHVISARSNDDKTIKTRNTILVVIIEKEDDNTTFNPLDPNAKYVLHSDKEGQTIFRYETASFYVKEIVDGVELDRKVTDFKVGIKGSSNADRFDTGTSKRFTETGTFEFDATLTTKFNGETFVFTTENTVTINVKDKEISGYSDNFYRNVLLTEWTASWCTNCPNMAAMIEYVMESVLVDRIIPIALHPAPNVGSERPDYCYVSESAIALFDTTYNKETFGQQGIPWVVLDWDKDSFFYNGYSAQEISDFVTKSMDKVDLSRTPGLAIETSLNDRELSYTIKITPRDNDEYLLGVYFIEDGVVTEQTGSPTGTIANMNVVHYNLTEGDNPIGLKELGSLTPNEEFKYEAKFDIPVHRIPADHVFKNCRLIYYVCRKDNTTGPYGFRCANVGTVTIGKSTEYKYEPIYKEE